MDHNPCGCESRRPDQDISNSARIQAVGEGCLVAKECRDRDLCPNCTESHLAKKREMERELKRLAGIETIEVDL